MIPTPTLLRLLLRRQAIAIGAFMIIVLLLSSPTATSGNPIVGFALEGLLWATILFVVFRFGLVAMMALVIGAEWLDSFPLTFDLSAWYAVHTLIALAALAALAGYAFWISLAGRPLFKDTLLNA